MINTTNVSIFKKLIYFNEKINKINIPIVYIINNILIKLLIFNVQ